VQTLLGPESEWPTPSPVAGWASRSGPIELRHHIAPGARPEDLRVVEEIAARYGWYLDERRADRLEALLDPEVEWSAKVEEGQAIGPARGRVAVLEVLSSLFWKRPRQLRHTASNTIVERQDSTGATICQTFLLAGSSGGPAEILCTGVNRLELVKRKGDWSIARIFVGFDSLEWAGAVAAAGLRRED
jgi:hypothetical protein